MKTLEKMILRDKPTVVVFYHDGIGDNKKVVAQEEMIRGKYGDKVEVMSYDCSVNAQAKEKYRFTEYPTWILFQKGGELMRLSGDKSDAELFEMVDTAV